MPRRPVRPAYLPPMEAAAAQSGYLLLRDGSTALIRPASPEDEQALAEFFGRLSPESRRRRFLSFGLPPEDLVRALCSCTDPAAGLTLLVIRTVNERPRILGVGTYQARDRGTAEMSMAVDDAFQGKGLGTLLLERLALVSVHHGFTRLWAVTDPDNVAMLDVFRESGFTVQERFDGTHREVELSVLPSAESVARSELRDRVATAASLAPFFRPRSVAVVGASRDPSSVGYRILEALVRNRFQGPVYPVNPKATIIGGTGAYPSVEALPEPVDLAVIAVPREVVPPVVEACARRGVRALVVVTAGFAEVNEEGRRLQARLVQRVREAGMRLVGPNCLGLLNTDPAVRLNASFSPIFPPHGRVAMLSQSGALGLSILAAAGRLHLGLSTFVSVGNKADVSGNDLLQYWEDDPATDVILLYLESFGNPRRFSRIARRVSRRKPIIAVKGGRTQAGRRAAGSHTAALAASDVAVDALFHQTGVLRADTLEDMFALASALGSQPLPAGRRVGIITNAGGPAILCADHCEAGGLTVPALSDGLRTTLAGFLPKAAGLGNPIDLIASAGPDEYRRSIEAVLRSDEVDALIVIHIPVGLVPEPAVSKAIREGVAAARAAGATGKPVLGCWMGEATEPSSQEAGASTGDYLPTYPFPELPARVLAMAATYGEWRARPTGVVVDFEDMDWDHARGTCRQALEARGGGWLTANETRAVLTALRLPVPAGGVARTVDEAVSLAEKIGYPVAAKLASHQIVHKTEMGVIHLRLSSADEVRAAFTRIRERLAESGQLDAMEGVLIQPMISGGLEVMVGVTQDPLFGPLLAFGLGGIHVEILRDVAFRITPLTDQDAGEMVREIKGFRLLEGYRGHPPADVQAIEEVLLRLSRFVEEIHEVTELDLNPVFALAPGEGCRIVDARIKVGA